MANNVSDLDKQEHENRLSKVLKILNLTGKYPGLLSREDMYQITKRSSSNELPKCHEELASYFIHKIARFNYKAREFCILRNENKQLSAPSTVQKGNYRTNMTRRAQENRGLDVSPMDIIIAVFLCCNDICRQDLVSHLWNCRLSIPLVIQEYTHTIMPSCFLWPLRNLVMKWEKQIDGKISVKEGRLLKEHFTSIAFIRVGEIGLSKSALINNVISVSEKTHSVFFHRDYPGSTKHRNLVDGLIDISWYFPMSKSSKSRETFDDHFNDAVTFLNLHGDAHTYQRYVPILSKLANIITVLCKVEDLDRCRDVIQPCLDMGNTVLLIFTDKEFGDVEDSTIENFAANIKAAENQLEYLEIRDKTRAELVQETRSLLMKLGEGKTLCLDQVCSSDIGATVDEKSDIFLSTKKDALAISSLLQKTPYKKRQKSFLYLQGEPWINWALADKEKFRISNKKIDEDVQIYMSNRAKRMKEWRSQQQKFLKENTHELVDIFLSAVRHLDSTGRNIFLRWLKFEIDDLSRKDLSTLYEDYHITMQKLAKTNDTKEKEKINLNLANLDNEVALLSFSLEHIMREIGQIYEALCIAESQHPLLKQNLPNLAANILLDGYPFELFDGYVNAVPIDWVTDVLRNLDHILKVKHKRAVRIKVISTLGIQSSGKSTMLNALFGCKYAVSAGRCTRGLYCQLVNVEETYSTELGIDYVFAIDTEGLRAPELSASGQMVKHDNELSTFVIGLADLTILNVMGENTTSLDELLPISIHAFLRMRKTTLIKPKCIIVHQNVNKEDKQNLLQQGQTLIKHLDTMTEVVCTVERTVQKSFKDIIEFDVSKDIFYLPAILEGIQPMAPISTYYSDELNNLKETLVQESCKQTNTLTSFIIRLQTLWSAIKKDDFVYQFRNAIETHARSKLDEYWCRANWKFRQPIRDILQEGYIEIQNTQNASELANLVKRLESKVMEEVRQQNLGQKHLFSTFLSRSDTLIKDTMMKWSADMNNRFDELCIELERDMRRKLNDYEICMKRKFSLKDEKSKYEVELKENITKLIQSEKKRERRNLTVAEITNLFEQKWGDLKAKLLQRPTDSKVINMDNDAFHVLSRAFPSEIEALQDLIQVKHLSDYDLHDFKAEVQSLKGKPLKAKQPSTPMNKEEDLAERLFRRVIFKLKSRQAIRPYSNEDIEEVVQIAMDHFSENRKTIILRQKDEVRLAVIVCGHAIKYFQRIQDEYEKQNSLENLLEKEKKSYERIFIVHCEEADIIRLLTMECKEILKKGILWKMTQTLPNKIETDLMCKPFNLASKSMVIYDHMIDMARDGSYENFKLFISDPHESITRHICKRIDQYAQQTTKPFERNFLLTLKRIEAAVEQALDKSIETGGSDFTIWLEAFRSEAGGSIILENIDKLGQLGNEKVFDQNLFSQGVIHCFKDVIQEIKCEISSYLEDKNKIIKDDVMKRIFENTVGCTTGCPFCGAICMMAKSNHSGEEHQTTLHRPRGCKGRNYIASKDLVTNTCPHSVSTTNEKFMHIENEVEKWCDYKDYKSVYPEWRITSDETGDETSFWNCFFAKYADTIAGNELNVPQIPLSWKELEWKNEIRKLEDKMKMLSKVENDDAEELFIERTFAQHFE